MTPPQVVIRAEGVEPLIFSLRGHRVMLSTHLAPLYGVEAKVLVQAVKRNPDRFPDDFMFLVKPQEFAALRSQSVTLKRGQHAKYPPYAFTEQGVAMLSAVLRSPRAVQTSIAIVRAFVRLRGLLVSMDQLARKVEALERKSVNHDSAVQAIFQALKELMNPREKPAREIGFHVKEEKRKAEARRDK